MRISSDGYGYGSYPEKVRLDDGARIRFVPVLPRPHTLAVPKTYQVLGCSVDNPGIACISAAGFKHSIQEQLHIPPSGLINLSWHRPNLRISVSEEPDKDAALRKILTSTTLRKRPSIVYVMLQVGDWACCGTAIELNLVAIMQS